MLTSTEQNFLSEEIKCFTRERDLDIDHVLTEMLYPDNSRGKLYILTGPAACGKTRLVEMLSRCKPNSVETSYSGVLSRPKYGGAQPGLYNLLHRDPSLIVMNEIDELSSQQIDTLKMLLSRDKIIARPLYSDVQQFTPKCNVLIVDREVPSCLAPERPDPPRSTWFSWIASFFTSKPKPKPEPTIETYKKRGLDITVIRISR